MCIRDRRSDIERGQVLCKPGTIHPHTKFHCSVYVLKKEEGGRHKPFFNNYRPQFYFRTTDVTGIITLPEGTEMAMPGDNLEFDVELIDVYKRQGHSGYYGSTIKETAVLTESGVSAAPDSSRFYLKTVDKL